MPGMVGLPRGGAPPDRGKVTRQDGQPHYHQRPRTLLYGLGLWWSSLSRHLSATLPSRMTYSWNAILSIMVQRRSQDSSLIRQMIDIRDRYNGDVVVPLPDVDGEPQLPMVAAQLITDGIDNTAMQAASARPSIYAPAADPTSTRSRKRADERRRALYSCWHFSALWDVHLYRAYRHLCGYGTAAWVVLNDDPAGRARVEIRDPLTAYPELRSAEDLRNPSNCGFIYGRSREWLTAHYPESEEYFRNSPGHNWDTLWDVVEWIDEEDLVLGILGPRLPAYGPVDSRTMGYYGYELRRWTNRAGMCPVVAPRRVTLDRIQGQLTKIIPTTDLLQRLTALDIVAAEKAIFPDMVAIGKGPTPPQLISGPWKDGRSGKVNLLTEGDVKFLQSAPGPLTHPVLDRLERAARSTGSVSPFYSGENTGSLRTGKAIDTLGSFSIDPRVEELQKIMGRALTSLNEAIAAVEKGYYPNKKIVGYTGFAADTGLITYTPGDVYSDIRPDGKSPTATSVVEYDFPGQNVSEVTVTVGQLDGAKLISKSTARRKHPYISDPDFEEEQIIVEQVKDAVLQSLLQQATSGSLPLNDLARILKEVENGADLVEAVNRAHEAAQQRQATMPTPEQAGPGGGPAPGSMPGLAAPGMGAETQPGPGQIGPAPNQVGLKKLISAVNAGRGTL